MNQFEVPVNPLSKTLLANLWPSTIVGLPATLNNYFATSAGTGYSNNGVAKVDWNINPNNTLSFRWFGGQGSQTQPPGFSLALATASSNLGYYFEVAPLHVQNYSLIWNSVITPRLTNQVLLGVSSFYQTFHDANNTFNTQALGLYLSPDALIGGQPIFGAPNIIITGSTRSVSPLQKAAMTLPATLPTFCPGARESTSSAWAANSAPGEWTSFTTAARWEALLSPAPRDLGLAAQPAPRHPTLRSRRLPCRRRGSPRSRWEIQSATSPSMVFPSSGRTRGD